MRIDVCVCVRLSDKEGFAGTERRGRSGGKHVNCVTHNEIRQFNIDFSKTKLTTCLLIRITMRNFIRYEREQEEEHNSSSAANINRPLTAATQQRGLSELRLLMRLTQLH